MKRRKFLNYMSLATATALFTTNAQAMEEKEADSLFIFVQASGGWDVTSLCDPKGYLAEEVEENNNISNNAMNKSYAKSDIITLDNGISYPPITIETHGASHGVTFDYSDFFEKYKDELLIINGIDTQTNGHDAGKRYMMSGKLAEGYPAISALIAGVYLPSSPLGFITSGGYDVTNGFVAGTRVSNARTIIDLASPNIRESDEEDLFVYPLVFKEIKKARQERILRILSKQKLASVKTAMEQFQIAHSGTNELVKLVTFLDQLDENLNEEASDNAVFSQGRFAMAGFKAGLTTSVNISTGGFDTHGDNDRGQLNRLSKLLKGIDLLKQEAKNLGIEDKITFIIGSDFGRTPRYNASNGKDHWRVTSMMFMGNKLSKTGVIGSTTHEHQIEEVNPKTLKKDIENGIKINYGHINKALRKLANIDTNSNINQYYPLDSTLEDLDIF